MVAAEILSMEFTTDGINPGTISFPNITLDVIDELSVVLKSVNPTTKERSYIAFLAISGVGVAPLANTLHHVPLQTKGISEVVGGFSSTFANSKQVAEIVNVAQRGGDNLYEFFEIEFGTVTPSTSFQVFAELVDGIPANNLPLPDVFSNGTNRGSNIAAKENSGRNAIEYYMFFVYQPL